MNERQPHAALDANSRVLKARKIEMLLGLVNNGSRMHMLEVGCGSGGISHYFGTHPSGRYEVHAVDVKDSRVVQDGYDFRLVADTGLPYPDTRFDAVISNHVIEHVGDGAEQIHHLQELRRVLKPSGIGYLAVPNRWMLVEPHYRLAFLSWLPVRFRSGYLNRFRGVDCYDCKPLEMRELESMLKTAKLCFENVTVEAIRSVFELEGEKGILQGSISAMPDRLLGLLSPISPTLVYRIWR